MPKNARDVNGELGEWTVTNWTEDFSIDCNAAVAVIGDGLGTLIKVLIEKGILSGSVSA